MDVKLVLVLWKRNIFAGVWEFKVFSQRYGSTERKNLKMNSLIFTLHLFKKYGEWGTLIILVWVNKRLQN